MGLNVSLVGRVALEADGTRVDEERFPGRQGRLVFAYLVADQGRPIPKDELAEALWGAERPATWEKALAGIVSKLRGLLLRCGLDAGSILTSAFGCYRLDLPEGSRVDVLAASEDVREAEEALAADDLERCKDAAMRAATVARRPFLPGEEGAWIDNKRRELADVLDDALGCMADACLASGDAVGAARWAEEAIALEPFRETGYRRLMLAHTTAGNRAEALRVYERCRRLVAEELGAYPSPETESIYRDLLRAPSSEVRTPSGDGGLGPAPVTEPGQQAIRIKGRYRGGRRVPIAIGTGLAAVAAVTIVVAFLTRGDGAERAVVVGNSVAEIDPETGRVTSAVPVDGAPTGVCVANDASVWVTRVNEQSVSRIDPGTGTVRQDVDVGGGPSGIACGGGAVWVVNSLDGTVSRIDPKTNDVVDTIPVGNGPTRVAYGEGAVWVAIAHDRTVSEIDPKSGDVRRRIAIDAAGRGIAIDGGAIWITDSVGNAVVRLDPRTGLTSRVQVGSGPSAIAYHSGSVWLTNNLDGTVSRIDVETRRVEETLRVGVAPNGIAVTRDDVWVTDEVAGTVIHIDPRSRRVTKRRIGGRPEGLALTDESLWAAVGAAGAAHRGGTLRLMGDVDQFDSIDPARAYLALSWLLVSVTNDGLVGFKRVGGAEGNMLVPDLATALPIPTDNGRTYVFQLRKGVRFSTGDMVKPSDVRSTFERLFRSRSVGTTLFYDAIVGSRACRRRPARCDLSRGILTDDATRTVSFRLRTPDPEFPYQLALPFAAVVPAGMRAGERPVPGTGPYRIAHYEPKRLIRLVRNPHFRVWSSTAQPPGNPDVIELRLHSDPDVPLTAVERDRADWTQKIPVERLDELETRYAAQVHVVPQAETIFARLDTTHPPFDNASARRAVAYAVDRARLIDRAGGEEVLAATCQILPPSFPAYRTYCPYAGRLGGGGASGAPDLARARELVKRSGTAGMRVDIIAIRGRGVYAKAGELLAEAIHELGYRVAVTKVDDLEKYFAAYDNGRGQVAFLGWKADYPAASNFIAALFSCDRYFCDRAFRQSIQLALTLQVRDPRAANERWGQLERELLDRAIVIPLVNPKGIDFVSSRIGNYQRHPVFGALISQLWVR